MLKQRENQRLEMKTIKDLYQESMKLLFYTILNVHDTVILTNLRLVFTITACLISC